MPSEELPLAPKPEREPGSGTRCVSQADIEALAMGTRVPEDIAAHVDQCEQCQTRLRASREDSIFLTRVRTLTSPALPPEDAPRIPGYRAFTLIGKGSQGVVYKALQDATSRPVAIKLLLGSANTSSRQRARAEREAEIAARLRHPSIVTLYESRSLPQGRIAVVMEFVEGLPIDQWQPAAANAPAALREQLRVFAQVCGAIHHAHLNGVIHRDLKPDNILVTGEGRPVVLDFGIAKAGGLHTTQTGEFAGTPAFASPEQALGRPDDVDALTDVYSLGVILYKLVCKTLPYDVQGSMFEITQTITQTPPTPPRTHAPNLPMDLEAIMLRALRKDKHRRYQSAAELARDVERFLVGAPVEARSESTWYLVRKALFANRKRIALWAGAAALVLAAGTAVVVSSARAKASEQRAAAQREQSRADAVRARAVTEFLREALPNADPSKPDLRTAVGSGLSRLFYRLETGAFAGDPEVDQSLRRLWGSVYTGFGTGKAAGLIEYSEVSLRNGLTKLRLEHGLEHTEIAETLHELAGVVLARKRELEAFQLCERALAMRAKLLGEESIATADSHALMAKILAALGRTDESLVHAERAVAFYSRQDATQTDLARAGMSALQGRIMLGKGLYASADEYFRDALTRRLVRLTPQDPDLLSSLEDAADLVATRESLQFTVVLAHAWGEANPAKLAAAIRADARTISKPDRGKVGHNVLSGRTAALERAILLQVALLGTEHPAIVGFLLAKMRAAEGEGLTAIKYQACSRAIDVLTANLGKDDPSLLVCVEEGATLAAFTGQSEAAVGLARRALAIRGKTPAALRDPLIMANNHRHLGWYLSMIGRYDEAIASFVESRRLIDTGVGSWHHLGLVVDGGKAYALAGLGKLEEADRLSARTLASAQDSRTMAYDQVTNIRFIRAHVLVKIGKREDLCDARQSLEHVWNSMYWFLDSEYAWRQEMLRDLIAVCDAQGDKAWAGVWRMWLFEHYQRQPILGTP